MFLQAFFNKLLKEQYQLFEHYVSNKIVKNPGIQEDKHLHHTKNLKTTWLRAAKKVLTFYGRSTLTNKYIEIYIS